MITIRQILPFIVGACMLFIVACKKDKTSKPSIPELTTTEISLVQASTATGGGNITNNGGEAIVTSGVCWSKTNNSPSISDDTTKTNVSSGTFVTMLKNLSPSVKYYVRAYATNRNGTGYGNVVSFTTGNAAPIATTVSISGDAKADVLLTGNYTYSDSEGDVETGTIFQWYVANDATGAGENVISGATAKTFRVTEAQQGKYIRFGVTPKASVGNLTGTEVKSPFIGAIGEGTTVTFMYNGTQVTYGIIIGTSGKKWLDRNLGASRAASSITDFQAFGDLFQWGRLPDGHQLIARTDGTDLGMRAVNGTSTTLSVGDVPTTNAFIIPSGVPYDWRATQNNSLWQGPNLTNNPCPSGWRIPTKNEWNAEGFTNINDGFSKLKITWTGFRSTADGTFSDPDERGYYWAADVDTTTPQYGVWVRFNPSYSTSKNNKGNGYACRCIKN